MKKFLFQDITIKFIFFEILIFLIFYLIIGFSINPDDPFLINQPVSYFMVFLVTVTLFYGLTGGIITISLAVPIMLYFYEKFPLNFFLWHLLLTLIAGEFHYYWGRKIALSEEERRYIEEKFEDTKKDLFLLKISHDQIERSYLIKPISVRRVLEDIKKSIVKDKIPYQKFMELISQVCFIESGAIFLRKDKRFNKVAEFGDKVELDLDDPLVRNCIEKGEISFISQLHDKTSKYLSVIPVIDKKNDKVNAILLIKKMPFLHLHADNIFSISVFFFWFIKELEFREYISDLQKKFPNIDPVFLKELKKVSELKTLYDIESSIVTFTLNEEDKSLFIFLEERIRGLDIIFSYESQYGEYVICILLPLTNLSSCKGFIERIKKEIIEYFGISYWELLKYKIYEVEKHPIEILRRIGINA